MVPGIVSLAERSLSERSRAAGEDWRRSLAEAIRDPNRLLARLGFTAEEIRSPKLGQQFPLLVPESFLKRMQPRDINDPLLRQVLPIADEDEEVAGFKIDALDEATYRKAPGLLQKYEGRALLVLTGACAVHCRYCFRRHYPYSQEPKRFDDWEPAFAALEQDESIHEVLLSGGDPLMLTDERLTTVVRRLESIPHLRRLRWHTRLPIVLPDRVTLEWLDMLTSTRLTSIVVVHANHPHELVADCALALRQLTQSGVMTLNQAVLLRGVNDAVETLVGLSERLIDLGIKPYYLHQLDRVAGTAHFEVPEETGLRLMAELRQRLPGYAVPQYVREAPGQPFKVPLVERSQLIPD
ncbi:MAG: EF-P beta-lysylation protein EpmB [Planctomycetes bacterium]|nr:EF-P beta-lysylation protein EpmB [Planctomycetota bacterium]